MIGTTLLIVVGSLLLYAIYKYIRRNDNYFEKQNVKQLRPYFLFGNSFQFIFKLIRVNEWCDYLYNSFPDEKIFGMFTLITPLYFIRDPETLKQLTVKDFDHFEDHRLFLSDPELDSLLGNSLIILRGDRWREMRSTLSPAFTGSKMRQMFDMVCECAETMSQHFLHKSIQPGGEIIENEMKDIFKKCTSDIIASIAFGIKLNSFDKPDNEFAKMSGQSINFNTIKGIAKLICMTIAPSIMKLFKIELMDPEARAYFKSIVLDTMNYRDKHEIYRPDMINILMQLRKGLDINKDYQEQKVNNDGYATVVESTSTNLLNRNKINTNKTGKREWTDDEFVAQCFLFFFAGFDSTASMLSFTAYELAINEDIQERLYQEINQTHSMLKNGKLSYDALQQMKYLDMVVSESLRLWPPTIITDRLCNKDYQYDDGTNRFIIEKNTILFIPIYSYHHDEKFFPNPKKFDPERFSDENKGNIIPGTYVPFGTGPRSCIGSRFALMEVKAVLFHLLLNFKFVPTEKTQIPLKLAKTPAGVFTEKGVTLKFEPRK